MCTSDRKKGTATQENVLFAFVFLAEYRANVKASSSAITAAHGFPAKPGMTREFGGFVSGQLW